MNGLTQKERYNMEDLLEIVALLRDPENGCPWDKVQTHTSIRKNFIEETYEVADAIDLADASLLCEELGDVLLQVALHTRMEEEQGAFTFGDVCTGICKKLIYRHPHILGTPAHRRRTRRCRVGRRSSAGKSTAKARGMTWTACPRPCRR